MTWFLIKLLIRVVVFGVAIAFVMRRQTGIRVKPRAALPLVALTFAAMNTLLYTLFMWVVGPVVSILTLGLGALALPFVLNGAFLWATQRVVKNFKIDGLIPLAYAAFVLTVAHFVLRLVHL